MTQSHFMTGFAPIILLVLIGCVFAARARWSGNQVPIQVTFAGGFSHREYKGPLAFIRRHYNGDYALARSYWAHMVPVSLFAPALSLLLPWIGDNSPARYFAIAFLFVTGFGVVAWFWAVSGTWASANKHVSRGGKSGWATLAKIIIFIGLLRTISDIETLYPTLKEFANIAAGAQLGAQTKVELRSNGRSVLLSGGINDGSAAQLEAALQKAPKVTTVVLASGGGWIREGELLADVIRKRGLSTYVESHCASACTIAFLAGKERAAAPMAKIGFHESRGVGSTAVKSSAQETARLRKIYRAAGLPADFVNHALDTPHDGMWYPAHDELLSTGVLTRKSMGGETTAIATEITSRDALAAEFRRTELFEVMAKRFPSEFEKIIEAAWRKARQGATDAEVIVAARREIVAKLPGLVAIATDDTIAAYHRLKLEQLEALRTRDVAACAEMAFPTGKSRNVVGNLPPELVKRELALMTSVLKEADEARRIKPNQRELVRVARRAALRIPTEQREAFKDEATRRRAGPAVSCAAAIAFSAGLQAFPASERAQALRLLFVAG